MSQSGWRRGTEFEADKPLETALVKAVFDGHKFVTPTGDTLPQLRAGARVEIRVPAFYFLDPAEARPYVANRSVEFLPAGTRLYAVVKGLPERDGFASPSSFEQPLSAIQLQDRDYVKSELERMRRTGFAAGVEPHNPDGAVEVNLHAPLRLTLRGDKKPTLEGCHCDIPYLSYSQDRPDGEAHSLNHAFTRISEYFETERISHTGNAFTRFFYEQEGRFERLDRLAAKLETSARAQASGVSAPVEMTSQTPDLPALFDELATLCKAGVAWAKRHDYPAAENYPQHPRTREIGEVLNAAGGHKLMQQAVQHVYAHVNSPDGGQAALLEYGWSGIGRWQA